MKTYLVTGAAGFIGSKIAKKLIEDGHSVVTIDNLSTGYKENIPMGVKFYHGDCQDINIISQLTNFSFDAIFHIAGQSSGEISFDDPVYDLQTNAQSTLILLKLASIMGCKKFIYASTMSVYGDKPDKPVKENSILLPKSFYGVGKIASEQYLRLFQQYGIITTALRLFNVYGPGQNMNNLRQGMVSIFLSQAINQKHIYVKGDANRYRDFIFVSDVVDAFIKSVNRETGGFQVINISTGLRTTVKELINIMEDNLPYKVKVTYSGSTPGDQFGITGNNKLASKILKWQPKITLKEGMNKMVQWGLTRRINEDKT